MPAPWLACFSTNRHHFSLVQDIIGINLLTKFHEDLTVNLASRFHYSHIRKNALPLGSHVFQANIIIFELIQDIIKTNLLTKFHENWTINEASRPYIAIYGKCPPLMAMFLKQPKPFSNSSKISLTNLLTKFHDDRKINLTSRVLKRKNAPPPWWPCFSTNRHHFLT
ncbi:hypothetical protein DPMN_079987 [Dreissena polymorpha]|uniref:Uncharacterized protein n=1 Tax=Dreissena polymorpha TaxID=45954 RepID=A0A9D4BRL1_DREPO|nr:hypothetical protein DPMN_079987 [Dreissena polymorpha]